MQFGERKPILQENIMANRPSEHYGQRDIMATTGKSNAANPKTHLPGLTITRTHAHMRKVGLAVYQGQAVLT